MRVSPSWSCRTTGGRGANPNDGARPTGQGQQSHCGEPQAPGETGGLVAELDRPLSRRRHHSPHRVIGLQDRHGLSVAVGVPARVPAIGENDKTGRLHVERDLDPRGDLFHDLGRAAALDRQLDRLFDVGDLPRVEIFGGEFRTAAPACRRPFRRAPARKREAAREGSS